MKMFYTFYVWLVALIKTLKGDLPAPMEEKKAMPLRLNLQFFADDADDDDSDDADDDSDDDDSDDDEPSLDELLKNPAFKKQYNQKFKDQMSKRLKKYEGVDPEEYKRLKAAADKKSGKDSKDDDDNSSDDSTQQQRFLRAERREKKAVVKEFAVDNGHNPKLLARLLDIDAIELDENGDPENLDELFEELETDFPEYFGASEDEDEDEEERPAKKKKGYVPGSTQKGNKKKKLDPAAQALADIERRHGKKKEE